MPMIVAIARLDYEFDVWLLAPDVNEISLKTERREKPHHVSSQKKEIRFISDGLFEPRF
jgi:hypothetical protein